ncbi:MULTISPECIES: Gfo/Idh/MocA family oxidoreductase [unclassified Paenibacillus]|uniref:Gfo/Idh/MocA family protein n=1 Tax=unclassified Paenibacillus TaxID=185978 RepID=UPI002406C09E|nr:MULTISPECIES: Gfo/Idh/MocA family oxidoreductase [unclassified Paenibacillus]MDF9842744.1 putative dehydrogenase [Paenibacillus sp. PastF-2]MDF9849388.1 putative dehydrogenase [Paenibacillus sp. PastM-2]MDF9855904.1 putative dehydrogenase [Paenibacillus sp. PastF-1]MDH6481229.1 putative dehydrogenase [Paenibacillus sp. PastH-2]MDH6508649.1 putative dehydrogenase [Paenibacillus sp. PastM-3]
MGLDTSECETMLAACEKAGVPLYVAYYRRGLPRFRKVKEWLNSGAIGEPRFVRTLHMTKPLKAVDGHYWRLNPAISGGGLFMDLGSHALDLLDFLLGPVKDADGHASSLGAADPVHYRQASWTRYRSKHGPNRYPHQPCYG